MTCKEEMINNQENIKIDIRCVCSELADFLIHKNTEYGNSALCPIRIFSQADTIEQIKVRMDDKLNRMITPGEKTISEDTVKDFVGYWVLLQVAERMHKQE